MERLRLNQTSNGVRGFPARPLGSEKNSSLASPVAAARELRERTSATTAALPATPETGLARAFVIAQNSIYPKYDPAEGWKRGTLFVSLDKPLKGVHGCE